MRNVGQSTPLPGASNTLTFTLVSNVILSAAVKDVLLTEDSPSSIRIVGVPDVDTTGTCASQVRL